MKKLIALLGVVAALGAWRFQDKPGEMHKVLGTMAGSWTTVAKMSVAPGQPETETKGTCESKMTLGGRYLEFEYKSSFAGNPYEGHGILAYDNVKNKFTLAWIENLSTGIQTAEGDYDAAKKTITLGGEYKDPGSGATMKYRWVYTLKSDKEFTFEMWDVPPPDKGKEFKGLTITYTRK